MRHRAAPQVAGDGMTHARAGLDQAHLPKAAAVLLPTIRLNLEDPALFNRIVEDFFHQVESGRWA
jgi:hypothetical protein